VDIEGLVGILEDIIIEEEGGEGDSTDSSNTKSTMMVQRSSKGQLKMASWRINDVYHSRYVA
jgi:hypothetical protein